jgi:hypothetical protein
MSRGFPSHKNVTYPTATNILTSSKLGGGGTYMSVMANNQPLTGRSRREREMCKLVIVGCGMLRDY